MKFISSLLIMLFICNSAQAIPTKGSKMMIAAPSQYAVEVGKEIYKSGGNVFDVAVAIGLTLSVTSPYFASLGGGGFALLKKNGQTVEALDFREMAPAKTGKDFYVRSKLSSTLGGAAVGVPGVPAGLWAIHKKYGKLKWKQLFKKPIQLAEKGFQVSGEWVGITNYSRKKFNSAGIKYFTKNNKSYIPGDTLQQKQLVKALKRLRDHKLKGFYQGPVAKDIIHAIVANNGVMTLDDLKNYKVRWLKPIVADFSGHKIHMMPPPSSGGVVIKTALALVDKLKLKNYEPLSVNELHFLGEVLARSFRGRSLLGDPDYHKNPISFLSSKKYINEMAKTIRKNKVVELEALPQNLPKESNETTHFSVLDSKGNGVAFTLTLNGIYGSKVISEKFGIALNNEMDDFTTRPGKPNMFGLIQGQGNLVEPGKRPLSSMTPTLVEKDGKLVMSLGAPGGPRIISAVFQALYRVLASGFNMDLAIQSPRVHHQFLPRTLFYDDILIQPATLAGLKKKGHNLKASSLARVAGVRLNDKGELEAAFDSRGEGAAGGY